MTCEPVGIKEIADRLHVKRETVDTWLYRGLLPASEYTVGGRPAWSWQTIEKWAQATDRLNGS